MKKSKTVFTPLNALVGAAFFLGFSTISTADQNPTYDIEVIVFKTMRFQDAESEQWALNPGFPNTDKAALLATEQQLKSGDHKGKEVFLPNPTSDWKLGPQQKKLAGQSAYKVLLHTSWKQPVASSSKEATPVLITGGKNIDSNTPNFSGTTLPFELSGTITLSLPRGAQMDVDLLLQAPALEKNPPKGEQHAIQMIAGNWTPAPNRQLQNFRLVASQKVKSKEIYYFDHPAFGVIVQIRR